MKASKFTIKLLVIFLYLITGCKLIELSDGLTMLAQLLQLYLRTINLNIQPLRRF